MRKIFLMLSLIMFLVTTPSVNATENLQLAEHSKSACLIEVSTNHLIYEKNAYDHLAPASMTKIMTLILIMESIEQGKITLEDKVTTPKEASELGGSQIYLSEGEVMTVDDLLKSVAIASANDAALSLAMHVAGTEANFVEKMNNKLKELNLTNTNFVNPYGLDAENHYSCSYDMAIMASYLITNHEEILSYTSLYEDYVREDTDKRFWLVNTNKLIKFYEGVDGLKTGWTDIAGYCLTATIKKNDVRYVAVSMGCLTPQNRSEDIVAMLNYATTNYEIVKLYNKGDIIKTYNDINVSPNIFNICLTEDAYILKRKDADLKDTRVEENININTNNLKDVGTAKIYYDNVLLKEIKLEVLEVVKKASILDIFCKVMKEIFLVS